MKNKKKVLIIGSCIIFILIVFLLVINLGPKMNYEKKTRKYANMWFEISVDKEEEPGSLKYLYTIHNKDKNLTEVIYYTKLGNSILRDSDWLQLIIPISEDAKVIGEPQFIYNPDYMYEEYMARPDKVTVIEDERGTWERVDRIKGQGFINAFAVLALLMTAGGLLFYNKDDIKKILSSSNKENIVSSNLNDKTLKSVGSENVNLNKIKELSLMKEGGLITEEEFETKKRDIIDKM
ncbi:SHOCT domain-containing protein [Lacrimispora sp.]|uniref:SHOCT domain-containing protein n=1 Tax=Lacrimispora sp. TaxID=2719234 RepID=UPI0032E4E551